MSDLSQSARDYLALRHSLGHKLVMAACLLPVMWNTSTRPGRRR